MRCEIVLGCRMSTHGVARGIPSYRMRGGATVRCRFAVRSGGWVH
jgi:hypothetical protein